jgi:hypothetical protein
MQVECNVCLYLGTYVSGVEPFLLRYSVFVPLHSVMWSRVEHTYMCACVNSTSSALSPSPPADYQVPGAVLSEHLGAAVNKIKDATLTSPGTRGRPLVLLHLTAPRKK